MPTLSMNEAAALARLQNKIFDVLRSDFELSEKLAAELASKAATLIRDGAEGKI